MSWFTHSNRFQPRTYIRSGAMNNILDRISQCFNWLPAVNESGRGPKGFTEPLAVGDAADPQHAPTTGQIVSNAFTLGVDSGAANHYNVNIPVNITSYTEGFTFTFKPLHNSTGPSDVQINGLGYVPIKFSDGREFGPNSLINTAVSEFSYNGSEFRASSMLAGDTTYINQQRDEAHNYALESQQWAIGTPSEPTGGSSKHWAQEAQARADELNSHEWLRADTSAVGGMGASATSGLDWDHAEVARAGSSPHLLQGSNPHGPGDTGYYHPFCFEYGVKDGTGNVTQFAIGYNTDKMFMRHRFNGTWTEWNNFALERSIGGLDLTSGKISYNGALFLLAGVHGTTLGTFDKDLSLRGETVGLECINGSYTPRLVFKSDGSNNLTGWLEPNVDNGIALGTASLAFSSVHSHAFNNVSDERLKDIQDIGDTSWVYDVEPIAYTWKKHGTGLRFGVSAQQTQAVVGKDVDIVKEGETWSVEMDQFIAPILNEMKRLRDRIEELENA